MTETIQQLDLNIDLLKAILWQYETAERLQSLLLSKQGWYDENQKGFWLAWIRDVFDLRTANDFGLQVWAIILGQPITITQGADTGNKAWGFDDTHFNFENGNFANINGDTFGVSTETARIILRMRYFQLTSAGTVPEINRMLKYLFADMGPAYLQDHGDMTQTYIFAFPLPFDLAFAFSRLDILPRPAGVGSDFDVIINDTWGFGPEHETFDNGNFSGE